MYIKTTKLFTKVWESYGHDGGVVRVDLFNLELLESSGGEFIVVVLETRHALPADVCPTAQQPLSTRPVRSHLLYPAAVWS